MKQSKRGSLAATWLGAALVAAVGCHEAPARPALQLDVAVRPDGVALHAIEAARPDACGQRPFAQVGVCDDTSDGWSCDDPIPAAWLSELRVEVDGAVIGTGRHDAPFGGHVAVEVTGTAGAVLVVVTDDGDEIAIPLPATAPPRPTIDEVVERGDQLEVRWSSAPAAASAVVSISDGFGSSRCHVASPGPALLPTIELDTATLRAEAFAAPTTAATALGEARIWVGSAITRDR